MASPGFSDIPNPLCNSEWVQNRELRCLSMGLNEDTVTTRAGTWYLVWVHVYAPMTLVLLKKIADTKFNVVFKNAYWNYASQLVSNLMWVVTEVQSNDTRNCHLHGDRCIHALNHLTCSILCYVHCFGLMATPGSTTFLLLFFSFWDSQRHSVMIKNRNCWAFILCAKTCP